MENKYKAFISYRRTGRDSVAAEVLQQMLEQYVIPEGNQKSVKKKLGSFFRDVTHISADPNLRHVIYDALDSSEYLIVICSAEIVDEKHPWVMDEIKYFLNKHPNSRDKILTVLVEDEPRVAIPDILWTKKVSEDGTTEDELPNYIDVRGKNNIQMKKRMRDQLVKVCATLISCDPDKLAMREEKRRRKQTLRLTGVLFLVAAIIIGILTWSNIQINRKNEELKEQISERQLRESELLTQRSVQALASGNQHGAIRDAIDALPSSDVPRPYYAPAEQALFSALDLFDPSSNNLILRDTVLELTSPVDKICVNADGTHLTTIDRYGNLNCFDVANGALIWTQKISHEWTGDTYIYACELYDSIIVIHGKTMISLSQNTGEVLWDVINDNFSDRIELSNDGSYAFCLLDDACYGTPMLAKISMLDGSFVKTTPLLEEYSGAHTVHTDAYAFSSDECYFAGCFYDYSNENGGNIVIFLMDTITGEIEILSREADCSNLIPCSVEFTDDDNTLTIIQYAEWPFTYRAEKICLEDGTVLWETDTPEEEFWYYAHDMKYLNWLYFDEYLLLGAQQKLYMLDMATGTICKTVYLDSDLICMESLDFDTLSLVQRDGTYITGHISSDGLNLHEYMTYLYDPVPVMNLGEVWDAYMINGGYLRVEFDTEVRPTVLGVDNNLPCCVVIVPEENDCSVIIRQPIPFDPILEAKELYTYFAPNGNILSAEMCGMNTLVVESYGYESQHMLFDRVTLESKGTIIDNRLSSYSLMKEGTSMLGSDGDGNLCIYDLISSKNTRLAPFDGEIQMYIDGQFENSTVLGTFYGRLTNEYTLATIIVTEHGLRIWLDDQRQPDIPFPAELYANLVNHQNADLIDNQIHCELSVNENGCVQLCLLGNEWECICDQNYIYNIWEKTWCLFPVSEDYVSSHIICLGASKTIYTIINNIGTIQSYDMLSGEEILRFNTDIRPNTIEEMRWIMDDRYLAIRTHDLQVFILDGITGEVVFSHTATMINHATDMEYAAIYEPQYATDSSGKYLYIWDQEGICVDTESWTKLVDIPHMLMYDPVSDMVLIFDSFGIAEDKPKHVTAVRIPTTEELIAIGKAYLGE